MFPPCSVRWLFYQLPTTWAVHSCGVSDFLFCFSDSLLLLFFAISRWPGTEQSGSDWTQGMMRRRLGWKGSTATPTTYTNASIFVCLVYLMYLVYLTSNTCTYPCSGGRLPGLVCVYLGYTLSINDPSCYYMPRDKSGYAFPLGFFKNSLMMVVVLSSTSPVLPPPPSPPSPAFSTSGGVLSQVLLRGDTCSGIQAVPSTPHQPWYYPDTVLILDWTTSGLDIQPSAHGSSLPINMPVSPTQYPGQKKK